MPEACHFHVKIMFTVNKQIIKIEVIKMNKSYTVLYNIVTDIS